MNEKNNVKTIFEDDTLLVLDKPSGMDVEALQAFVRDNFTFELSNVRDVYRNGLVHRLDKPTSGIIIFAKTKSAFENLQNQFTKRGVRKQYIALVHGEVKDIRGTINTPVGRLPWNRMRFGVFTGGRPAVTRYEVSGHYLKDAAPYTLVNLFPKTGRTHQLRVHLKSIGHAVVSDPLYAGRKTLREDLKWCPRMFLHASKIEFTNPTTDKKVSYESKLPADLQIALDKLSIRS